MVQYKITYFDIRRLGETPRLILHYGGVDFIDNRITHEQWRTLKESAPSDKLPYLEIDGKALGESGAICRYLAAKFGLRPADNWENAQMEAAIDSYRDFSRDIIDWFVVAVGRKEGDKEKLYKELYEPAAEKAFARLTEIISKSSSGFLVNNGLSWGDFFLAESILTLQNLDPDFGKKFPKIVEYQKRIHANDKVKAYISKRKETKI